MPFTDTADKYEIKSFSLYEIETKSLGSGFMP